jgi:hypothetical protein
MAITEAYGSDGLTVSTTELSLISGTSTLQNVTDDGQYQVMLDPVANVAKGDSFLVRVYEKVRSGSTKRVVWSMTMSHANAEAFMMPTLILGHGFDFTIIKLAGTDRAIPYRIMKTPCTWTEAYGHDALSVGTTEMSLTAGTTGLQARTAVALYQCFVDPVTNMAQGDDFEFRIMEKCRSGTTQRQVHKQQLANAQGRNFVTPALVLGAGWDFGLKRTAGSDRAFDVSVRSVA